MASKSELTDLLAEQLEIPRSRVAGLAMSFIKQVLVMFVTLDPKAEEIRSPDELRRDRQTALERLVLAARAEAKLPVSATAREAISTVLGADVFEHLEKRFAAAGITDIANVRP